MRSANRELAHSTEFCFELLSLKFPELMPRRLLVWRRHWWRGKLGVIDRDVLLHLVDLNGKAAAGTSERPAERNFDAVLIAIIGVVNLSGHTAESGFRVADKTEQQA